MATVNIAASGNALLAQAMKTKIFAKDAMPLRVGRHNDAVEISSVHRTLVLAVELTKQNLLMGMVANRLKGRWRREFTGMLHL